MVALIACFSAGVAFAVPNGYSINSDSPGANADSLYVIDLANGNHTRIGTVISLDEVRLDVEGLAFAPDGTLYGVDDGGLTAGPKLFPINTANGRVISAEEVFIDGVPTSGGGNDFGMSFACDGSLYITSVATQTLYNLSLDGDAQPVGAVGSLNANISAIAAYGNPVQLYGLGNGHNGARTLYSIDIDDGTTTAIGTLGGAAEDYLEAGMSFDESGQLWAVTDRSAVAGGPFPNQILQLDTNNGQATAIAFTSEIGFESLAISEPQGCFVGGGETARFAVNKRFMDRNSVSGATFTLSCNTGIPLEQSITVTPIVGAYRDFEVNFVVRDFESGTLDCELSEEPVEGYSASYSCDGMSACDAGNNSPLDPYFRGPCSFSDVAEGDENICFIRNYVDPVDVDVTKMWIDEHEEFQGPTNAQMAWACVNARSAGNDLSLGTEEGVLNFSLPEETQPFGVYPNFDPDRPTVCSVTEQFPGFDSDIESDASDCQGLLVSPGSGAACTITNTRLYAGIPTLDQYGKLLLALLMLGAGFVAVRRLA